MAKSPEKACPSFYRLVEHAAPEDVLAFLKQDEFARLTWLQTALSTADKFHFDGLLKDGRKPHLEPLDREAARVLTVSENRGQFALDGVVREKLSADQLEDYRKQKDELCRSLWIYVNHRGLFDAVESVLHHRLYRRYGKHYQSFQGYSSTIPAAADPAGQIAAMIRDIETRLETGSGCRIERFDLPGEADHPAAKMYIVYHPNPLTSAREIREDGERRTIYFRPPGEATIIYTPATGSIEVRADTRIIRRDVAKSFATIVLGQDLSSKPLEFREYDLSRFFDGFVLDCPELDGFHVMSAHVIRAEISVGNLGNRLSLSTTIHEDIDGLINRQPGLRAIFQRAVAVRFIEIAVCYRVGEETEEKTLDFTISDQNSCSLLSLPDERERILGHRLLRRWKILHEFRDAQFSEQRRHMPVLLELWNSGMEELPGSWLAQRNVAESALTEAGFLEPVGWEGIDLIDGDHDSQADARVLIDGGQARLQPAPGQEVDAGTASRYRKFRVKQPWLIEHVQSALSEALDAPFTEVLSPDLISLGTMDIEGSPVCIYFARRLDDPKVLAQSDHILRERSGRGIGLVLSAATEPFRCLAANVLSPLTAHLGNSDQPAMISPTTLRTAYSNNRHLARGGSVVGLTWDGGEVGELYVPGKGSMQIVGYNRLVVIERLVKAHLQGPRPVKSADLTKGFGGQALAHIFGKTLWEKLNGQFIRSAGHGLWEIAAGLSNSQPANFQGLTNSESTAQ